jgi:hypothetical protein
MAAVIYALCALVALTCTGLLLRGWRASRHRLLLWTGLCFAALSINNVVLFIDKVLLPPEIDLVAVRLVATLIGMGVLLYGLVWDAQ